MTRSPETPKAPPVGRGLQSAPGPTNRWRVTRALEREPLPFLLEMTTRYGDVVRLPHLVGDRYLIHHPAGVQQVLQEEASNFRRDPHENRLFERFVGQSILSTDGAMWKRLRRLEQPAFSRSHVAAVTGQMTEAIRSALEDWQAGESVAKSIDLVPALTSLTLSVLASTVFSVVLGREVTGTIASALKTINAYALALFLYPFLPLLGPLSARNRRAERAERALDQVVFHLIQQRRTLLEAESSTVLPGEAIPRVSASLRSDHPFPASDGLLTYFLQLREEDGSPAFSDTQLRNETLSLLIAGHENATSLLCWSWYLLARHTEVCERLYEEVGRVLSGRVPTAEDLEKLPFSRMVLEEALRLYPPAWLFPRQALSRTEIGGYLIPAGATIFLCPYTTQRHPDFWERPDSFEPERFLVKRSAGGPRYAYFPFGGGQHQCLGATFALQETHLALVMMAQRYRCALPPEYRLRVDARVTLRPHELPMRLSPL